MYASYAHLRKKGEYNEVEKYQDVYMNTETKELLILRLPANEMGFATMWSGIDGYIRVHYTKLEPFKKDE